MGFLVIIMNLKTMIKKARKGEFRLKADVIIDWDKNGSKRTIHIDEGDNTYRG